jgi:oligoendopeptidase F
VPIYDEVLKATARGTANDVTSKAGFDIETREFWLSGIGQIEEYVTEFEELVDKLR